MNKRLPPSFAMGPAALLVDKRKPLGRQKNKRAFEEDESSSASSLSDWEHSEEDDVSVEEEESTIPQIPSQLEPTSGYRAFHSKTRVKESKEIRAIVIESQQQSKHYQNELRKDAKVQKRIQNMLTTIAHAEKQATEDSIRKEKQEISNILLELEATRDLERIWAHIDMDAFYAACEMRENPALAKVPLAIGGMALITACNYIARSMGVSSPMPGHVAKKVCPSLVFLHGNHKLYASISEQVMEILKEYDANLEQTSLDEAYLDITKYVQQHPEIGSVRLVLEDIRKRIFETTQLTVSAGAGPNPKLAKMAGEVNKPNGSFVIVNNKRAILHFLGPLRPKKIPGIGRVQAEILRGLNVHNCADILRMTLSLYRVFGKTTFRGLVQSALGVFPARREDDEGSGRLSIGHQTTFQATTELASLEHHASGLANRVAKDLQERQLEGRALVVGVKHADFIYRTRSQLLPVYLSHHSLILDAAWKMILKMLCGEPVRLLSIRVKELRRVGSNTQVNGQPAIASFLPPMMPNIMPQQHRKEEEKRKKKTKTLESFGFGRR